jgi:hypothetical protein
MGLLALYVTFKHSFLFKDPCIPTIQYNNESNSRAQHEKTPEIPHPTRSVILNFVSLLCRRSPLNLFHQPPKIPHNFLNHNRI